MKHILTLLTFTITLSLSAQHTQYVNPFIGTGGHGHTFPGATMPFGMVQLSPDTRLTGWDGCSGYHYSDEYVYGFSHTHLSGTGVSDYGDILLMPTTGEVRLNNGADGEAGYRSAFSHSKEKASPGYYECYLEDYQTKVSLTCTERAGFHQYEFPATKEANVILDLEHRDQVLSSSIKVVNNSSIEGHRRSKAWSEDQHVYFVMEFSQPIIEHGIMQGEKLGIGSNEAEGTNLKAFFRFNTENEKVVLAKVGISSVSIEGARKNLNAEIPHWDFNKTKTAADQTWEKALSKIDITGGTDDQKSIFYTALYHNMIAPNLFMDVDGQYRGTDLKVHQSDQHQHYTIFSLWDTYRATHPLYTLIEQERTNDFIRTFLAQYKDGGQLPIWELAGNYTGCMIGYHSIPVIADAYVKGIRDYDTELALKAMRHSAEADKLGIAEYQEFGYIPSDKEPESVSKTLEYAYDDWCIAMMAKDLGKTTTYKRYIERAQSYKNIYDPSTGFMRAKLNNTWFEPFDPAEVNFNYTEANAWQYSFYVPQDISGFTQLLGGKDQLNQKLDALFTANSTTTGREQADITGLIGQYAHGNEPSHHMAYLYNYINRPWKTQEKVQTIMADLYQNAPDGLSGNEDCGQMSAWYVLSAMGFYSVTPTQTIYAIGSPIFEQANLNLENGNQFSIKAQNISDQNIYIQSAELNGKPYPYSYIQHEDIMKGGEMIFVMGATPNKNWGSSDEHIPVASINENLIMPLPFFKGKKVFVDKGSVSLGVAIPNATIHYTLDGSTPTEKSPIYQSPLELTESMTIKAIAIDKDLGRSQVVEAIFKKITGDRKIELFAEYANQYSGGGDNALIDFEMGGADFRTGQWQGYHQVDFEAIVDLGKIEEFEKLSTNCLQDQNSWIWMPEWVEYSISQDGKNFEKIGKVNNEVDPKHDGPIIKEFTLNKKTKARYIKVVAKNKGLCPEWHKGAGGQAWIFTDEILIE